MSREKQSKPFKYKYLVWKKCTKKPMATFDRRDDALAYIKLLAPSSTALAIFEYGGTVPSPSLIGTWAYGPNDKVPSFVYQSRPQKLH